MRRPTFRPYADEQKHSLEASTVYRRQAFKRAHMTNIILWLVAGGLIGWASSVIMRTHEGIALNVVVGIVGAALTGWVFSPLVGASTITQSNFSASLLACLLGAVSSRADIKGAVRVASAVGGVKSVTNDMQVK
jgi:uncharacterized membrane protein YeaQ/YmgE (transglycosylase-associated protein family)